MKYVRAVQFFTGTLLIYLVPPLLGWGLGDLGGFFSSYPRLGYAVLVALLGLGAAFQALSAPDAVRRSKGEAGKRVPRQSVVKVALILSMYGVLALLPFADRHGIGVWEQVQAVRWAGLAFVGMGFTLILWSGLALGRLYSADVTLQQDHHLITGGLYRHVRHPRYLGVLLLGLGIALLFRSWIGLALNPPLLALILFRIHDEEALLHREFGLEWETYCRHSRRLIPYVW